MALLVVLIVTILGISLTLASVMHSVDTARDLLTIQKSFEAHGYADACAELGLREIKTGSSFSGSGSKNFEHGSCDYVVSSLQETSSRVESTGNVDSITRKVRVEATLHLTASDTGTTTEITAADWSEPSDF